MEIILAVRKELELALRNSLKQKLAGQAGLIGFIYAVSLANKSALQRQLCTKTDCLIIAQVSEKNDGPFLSWEEVENLQRKQRNLFFLLLGQDDRDCCKAVQSRLHLVGYFNQNDEQLCEKITENILWISRMAIPFCDGIFVSRNGEYIWIPSSDICCIETVKGTHYCDVKCEGNIYSLRANIRKLELCIGPCFWRCRASTLINLKHIRKVDVRSRIFVLDGDYRCTYPKERSGEVRKLLKNHFERNGYSVKS
nr:LytTR family DNA-binding domain-containing protein [uncultured Agathobaculum sp.]